MKKPLLVYLALSLVFTNLAFSQLYSSTIGPRKNYLCEVENTGELFFYKLDLNADEFIQRSLSREMRSITRKISSLQKSIQKISSLSSKSRQLKRQLIETKSLLTALHKCARRSGQGVSGGGTPSTPTVESACSIIQGAQSIVTRIAKGKSCSSGTSPVVYLTMLSADGRDLGACTGTVINANTILSAGHCLDDGASRANVIVGGQSIEAAAVFRHPNYSSSDGDFQFHDVSILKFSSPLPVLPIPLLTDGSLRKNETVLIAGYGSDENENYGKLKAAFSKISAVDNLGIEITFKESGSTGNTCPGDSGGPILVKRGSTWVLAGVTSNGDATRCGANDTSRFANTTWVENLGFIVGNL